LKIINKIKLWNIKRKYPDEIKYFRWKYDIDGITKIPVDTKIEDSLYFEAREKEKKQKLGN